MGWWSGWGAVGQLSNVFPGWLWRVLSCASMQVELLLEPVAYTFAAGSKIRVAFAGADQQNFDTKLLSTAPEWRVHFGETSIKLPVIAQ